MREYYVYALLDPRINGEFKYIVNNHEIILENSPFYIGKGKKWRMNQHFSESNLRKKTCKNNKILKIMKDGYKPISIKLIENLEEKESYILEKDIISSIGLNNLTNKTDGGLGQTSDSVIGEKNPNFGKRWTDNMKKIASEKTIEFNKTHINQRKGKCLEEIHGEDKAKEMKKKISDSKKGKTWEEIYGEEKAKELKQKRSEFRKGHKHSEDTIEKIKIKINTPENISKRRESMLEKRKTIFYIQFENNKDNIENLINNGYTSSEIIKRIKNVSRFKIKKMIFLVKNNLDGNYNFNSNRILISDI